MPPMFGDSNLANIIMQGAQMINNSIQQSIQMEQQHAERMENLDLKQESLKIQKEKLQAEREKNEIEVGIMRLRGTKLNLEIAAKSGENFWEDYKLKQLSLAHRDPITRNKAYLSIEDLSKRLNAIDNEIGNLVGKQLGGLDMSDPLVLGLMRDKEETAGSLDWRLNEGAGLYGWTHEEAAVPMKIKPLAAASPEQRAASATILKNLKGAPLRPEHENFAEMFDNSLSMRPIELQTANLLRLKRALELANAKGFDDATRFLNAVIKAMPGDTAAAKEATAEAWLQRATDTPDTP